MVTYEMADTLTAERVKGISNNLPITYAHYTLKLLCLGKINVTQSNLLASPPSHQLQPLTLHDCASYDNRGSPLVAEECSGSGLVAHTPHQVVDGVLHTAHTGGDADCPLRGHSVLH